MGDLTIKEPSTTRLIHHDHTQFRDYLADKLGTITEKVLDYPDRRLVTRDYTADTRDYPVDKFLPNIPHIPKVHTLI